MVKVLTTSRHSLLYIHVCMYFITILTVDLNQQLSLHVCIHLTLEETNFTPVTIYFINCFYFQ